MLKARHTHILLEVILSDIIDLDEVRLGLPVRAEDNDRLWLHPLGDVFSGVPGAPDKRRAPCCALLHLADFNVGFCFHKSRGSCKADRWLLRLLRWWWAWTKTAGSSHGVAAARTMCLLHTVLRSVQ
jgi:hypothetical protein